MQSMTSASRLNPTIMPNCAQCKSSFEIPTAQQKALKQMGDLPLPTLCPSCRMQRRFAWRNERKLYYRKCDLTGKQIVSIYPEKSPYTVYDQHEWYSDKWNAMDYAMDYDFDRSFFEQFNELMLKVPKISVFTSRNENSDYTNGAQQDKNCYMIFVSDHDEDCYFSYGIDSCKDCIDCMNCYESELLLECIDCSGSYNIAYSQKSHACRDSYFLSDCKNCQDCFGCFGLRGKKHYIFNQQLTKEEYGQKLSLLNLGSHESIERLKTMMDEQFAKQQIFQHYDGNNNENVTGDHIVGSKNCIECYDSGALEDCGYLIFSFKSKDCFDGHVVVDNCELCYETISTINQYNTQFTFLGFYSKNCMYLDHSKSCQDCFGCSGLKQEQYCILNKKYSKDEYFSMVERIKKHMQQAHSIYSGQAGEWGMAPPIALSPFGYNETVAQEYFPLTKEEVLARGWKWFDDDNEGFAYQGPKTAIPDNITDVQDDIVDKILECKQSGKPYKIIPQELELYKQHGLPLSRLCFEERHLNRVRRRNPRKLWDRTCMKCGAKVATTFAPERQETIYCEACYLETVY
jgi:hypothetical protein